VAIQIVTCPYFHFFVSFSYKLTKLKFRLWYATFSCELGLLVEGIRTVLFNVKSVPGE